MTTNPRLELIEARAALKSYGSEGRRFEKAVRAVALHDAALGAAVVPPTGQTALRDLIAEALLDHLSRTADIRPGRDGALAFMPEITDEERLRIADAVMAVLPPPADRAAVLREEAALIRAHCPDHLDSNSAEGSWISCHCDVADDMLRRLAAEAPAPETQIAHACGNCQGIDPDSCLTNLDRPAVTAQKAATRTSDEAPDSWCKCRSCWGWFVEEHPGEDLDELGRDLGWWSGLPVHRDAPAGVQPDTKATPCSPSTACDPETGEPCFIHEREQAHADGEHDACGAECEAIRAAPEADRG